MGCTPESVVELYNIGFVTCRACCRDWCSECFTAHPSCPCIPGQRAIRRVHDCLFFTVPQ